MKKKNQACLKREKHVKGVDISIFKMVFVKEKLCLIMCAPLDT
jgi:hypothetical protein